MDKHECRDEASCRSLGFRVLTFVIISSLVGHWWGIRHYAIAQVPRSAALFELRPGEHVCIIGNTLADRMQHDGWLETYLQSRFPKHQLVFRNLGFSGDEVAGYTDRPDPNRRMRSMDFGTADQWLAGSAPIPQPRKLNDPTAVPAHCFAKNNTKHGERVAFFGYKASF